MPDVEAILVDHATPRKAQLLVAFLDQLIACHCLGKCADTVTRPHCVDKNKRGRGIAVAKKRDPSELTSTSAPLYFVKRAIFLAERTIENDLICVMRPERRSVAS